MKTKLAVILTVLPRLCLASGSPDPAGDGSVFYLILALVILVVSTAWIIFPFLVIGRCNAIVRELKKISGALVRNS